MITTGMDYLDIYKKPALQPIVVHLNEITWRV